jgi:hypothetical protein
LELPFKKTVLDGKIAALDWKNSTAAAIKTKLLVSKN